MATKILNAYCADQGLKVDYNYHMLGFTDIIIDGIVYSGDKEGLTRNEADKHTATQVIKELSKNKDTKKKLIEITNNCLQLEMAKLLTK
jgi:hypothetical protein